MPSRVVLFKCGHLFGFHGFSNVMRAGLNFVGLYVLGSKSNCVALCGPCYSLLMKQDRVQVQRGARKTVTRYAYVAPDYKGHMFPQVILDTE